MTSTSGRLLARMAAAPEAEVLARGGQAGGRRNSLITVRKVTRSHEVPALFRCGVKGWPSTAGMGDLVRQPPLGGAIGGYRTRKSCQWPLTAINGSRGKGPAGPGGVREEP